MALERLDWTRAPRVESPLPWFGPGLSLLNDPTAFFERQCKRRGDTFRFEAFGHRVLCVFSPEGLKNLWALPEAQASKGVADFALLAHKVPAELFVGRRSFPHALFSREDIEIYLDNLGEAVRLELAALGPSGELEAFAFTRRLSHRMGLASWGSPLATRPGRLEPLIEAFDALDSSESFVHPAKGFLTWASGKRREKAALARIEQLYRDILRERDTASTSEADEGFFGRICQAWDGEEAEARATGIARDVMLVHMG